MDVEGKEASSPVESGLLRPSHDVEDPSQTFLNSERAKYHPKSEISSFLSLTRNFQNMIDRMGAVVGSQNVSTAPSTLEQHSHDESYHRRQLPAVVVWPSTTQQVSEVVRLCSDENIAMVPYGTGTGVEGGVTSTQNAVCINVTNMKQITRCHIEDFDVTVQPGVTWKALNHHLKDYGVWFPVDPGSDASLCGMAATGASGTNTVRYGNMKGNVINLEVVLPDGKIINTAGPHRRAKKSSAGYNLTNLFVGSEGTLGIITSATLKLHALPESILSAACFFPTVEDSVTCAVDTIRSGIPIARMEYMDEKSVDATNKFSNLTNPVSHSLFLEFHGSENATREQVDIVEEIVKSNNGSNFSWAATQEARNKVWQARRDMHYAHLAQAPGKKAYTTDVCVPISNLPTAIIYARQVADDYALPCGILGHVGDGNFHCMFTFDPSDPAELQKTKDVAVKIARKALALDGTSTGEHGIGLGKKELLIEEMDEALDVMRSIKRMIDPKNLMNPDKVL